MVWRCCVVCLSVSEFLDEISVLFIIVCGMGGLSYKIFLSVWTFLKLYILKRFQFFVTVYFLKCWFMVFSFFFCFV